MLNDIVRLSWWTSVFSIAWMAGTVRVDCRIGSCHFYYGQGARKEAQADHQALDVEVMWISSCGASFWLLQGYWWDSGVFPSSLHALWREDLYRTYIGLYPSICLGGGIVEIYGFRIIATIYFHNWSESGLWFLSRSQEFTVLVGFKLSQVCVLSLILFVIFMDTISWGNQGVKISVIWYPAFNCFIVQATSLKLWYSLRKWWIGVSCCPKWRCLSTMRSYSWEGVRWSIKLRSEAGAVLAVIQVFHLTILLKNEPSFKTYLFICHSIYGPAMVISSW